MLRHLRKAVRTCVANQGLVLLLLFTAVIVARYNQTDFARSLPSGISVSALDFLIFDMGTSGQLSIPWLLSPVCSMALTAAVLSSEAHEMALLGHGSLRSLWLSESADAASAALLASSSIFLISLTSGLISSSTYQPNFTDVSVLMTGQETRDDASAALIVSACFVHLTATTLFTTLAFAALRRLTGNPTGAFVAVVLFLLPAIADGNSFVSDVLRNLPGIALIENPIHAFVAFQGVDWQRWVPDGTGMRLWFLPLLSSALVALVYVLAPKINPRQK